MRGLKVYHFVFAILFAGTYVNPCRAANLVVNGGFETGNFSGWNTLPAANGSFFGVDTFSHSGDFAAFFGADAQIPEYDQFFQVVPTLLGQQYTLEFYAYNSGVGNDSLQVVWEGVNVFDSTPIALPLEDWSLVSMQVTATAAGSELRFRGYDVPAFVQIDDVNVTLVPEPGAALLAGGAFAGIAVLRKRRYRLFEPRQQ